MSPVKHHAFRCVLRSAPRTLVASAYDALHWDRNRTRWHTIVKKRIMNIDTQVAFGDFRCLDVKFIKSCAIAVKTVSISSIVRKALIKFDMSSLFSAYSLTIRRQSSEWTDRESWNGIHIQLCNTYIHE